MKYGLYAPLIFIGVILPIATTFLCWDWRSGKRMSFSHVSEETKKHIPSELKIENNSLQNGDSKIHNPLVQDRFG